MKKSYHSSAEPIADAKTTRLLDAAGKSRPARTALVAMLSSHACCLVMSAEYVSGAPYGKTVARLVQPAAACRSFVGACGGAAGRPRLPALLAPGAAGGDGRVPAHRH